MEQPSKKTMRHFYCRDVLWETFEQMANDFDCSIDYLVNESMRAYAKTKNYAAPASGSPSLQDSTHAAQPAISSAPTPAAPAPASVVPPRPPPRPTAVMQAVSAVPPTVPARPAMPPPPPASSQRPFTAPPAPPPTPSVGPARSPGSPESAPATAQTLYLRFADQKYTIDKDQFIIGRGSKSSDLPIRDGNISRKHAAVIRRNGTFYIKDLGSTNGIDYKGMRIDNKRIDEGDIFHICDYELKFSYQG